MTKSKEQVQIDMLQTLAADHAREADDYMEKPEVRSRLLQTSAIYEVGAALLEQLVKLTRATRD